MRIPNSFLVAGVLTSLVLAGCAGTIDDSGTSDAGGDATVPVDEQGRPVIDAAWPDRALLGGGNHDHQDPMQHQNLSTPNFKLIGYEPLVTDWHGKTTGDYFCGDTRSKDGKRLSVVHSFGSDVAFVLIDTTDPAKPKKVGELVMGNTQVYDVTLTPNLDFVLLSTSPMDSGPDVEEEEDAAYGPILWRDACTGQVSEVDGPEAGLPYASGIVLVDIRNPRNPTVVDFRSFPVMGGHSVRAQTIKGEDLILVSVPNPGPRTSYYVFMDIQELPTGPSLNVLSTYQDMAPVMTPAGEAPVAEAPTPQGMHDAYMAEHPVTGEALAYLAYGGYGMVILNIDDPTSPRKLSYWGDWAAVGKGAPTNPYFHEALPAPEVWDGRHYTFLGEECVSARPDSPTCLVFTLDTTDPSDPQFVGAWTLPQEAHWDRGLEYSLHYLALVNRTLFASNYHGGVWAIDVSTPEALRTMPSIGAYLPANVSPKPPGETPRSLIINQLYGNYALDSTPTVLDLDPTEDGHLVVFDGQSGLYVIDFDETYPAPAPDPWPLGYLASDA